MALDQLHGGNMDPNQARLHQSQAPRNGTLPSSVAKAPSSDYVAASPNSPLSQDAQAQPVQYGSNAQLMGVPSPPSASNTYQSPQSPQSVQSTSYFPVQNGYQQQYVMQGQQSPQSPANAGTTGYYVAGVQSQSSSPPAAQYTGGPSYGPSQTWPVGFPPQKKKSKIRRVHEFLMNQGSNEKHTEACPLIQGREAGERGYSNAFGSGTHWRIKWPNTFKFPRMARPGGASRHRDIMQRSKDFPSEDYYLSPFDGHLAKLFVQSTQAIYDTNAPTTWRRTFIRNQSPLILQAANWVLHSLPTNDAEVKGEDLAIMSLKWLPACAAILLLMVFPVQASGEVRNGGKYDPLPYKFWGYPYHSRNTREARMEMSTQSIQPSTPTQSQGRQKENTALNPIMERPVEPTYLCFLRDSQGIDIREVSHWKREHDIEPTYVLVSYTSEQFATEDQQLFLHDIGEHAARAAGVTAYWVGCSCLGKSREEQENNVWQISDVVRGARSMVIAVSSLGEKGQPSSAASTKTALRQWGTRVWTLPEVLLIPSNSSIEVYARNADINEPMVVHKRNFATLWKDSPISRELIDHYEGNLALSSLELVTIALQCLHNRQKGYYLPGDMAYALMGLLRRRPHIVKTDSAFQAFARLSLANDSDLLLERLICILPTRPDQPWYEMEDQWGASLWDIIPSTQVCGIADNDTVIIDGGYAAAIRWKAFAHVANLTRESWKRFFFRYAFRCTSYLFIIGISLISTGVAYSSSVNIGIGAFLLTIALTLILCAPYIIRVLYTGKIWGTQAWFFGFEGYMNISEIENHIFGADMGHLKWSTNGSPLSMHAPNEYGECIGQDPCSNPETAEKVRRAISAPMGEERIFTLVDTYTLTVTMFSAVRPPIAVAMCGAEGGMQRALLCSYDWSTQTLYRESVLRMETIVLEQMQRVGRLRLGLRRGSQ
ncbi:hypothetical protein ACLMJK_007503 [Lecanora helva]